MMAKRKQKEIHIFTGMLTKVGDATMTNIPTIHLALFGLLSQEAVHCPKGDRSEAACQNTGPEGPSLQYASTISCYSPEALHDPEHTQSPQFCTGSKPQ